MKNKIIAIFMTTVLMMPFSVNANRIVSWRTKINGKEYYATNLIVKKVDRKRNKVTCKNWCGYTYCFYGVEDLEKDDVIACIMYTKGTASIKDDVIVTAKYERMDLFK